MLPSLTRLEPRYDVTPHTDSDGNAMKKLPGSVSPRLQSCINRIANTDARGLHLVFYTFEYYIQ